MRDRRSYRSSSLFGNAPKSIAVAGTASRSYTDGSRATPTTTSSAPSLSSSARPTLTSLRRSKRIVITSTRSLSSAVRMRSAYSDGLESGHTLVEVTALNPFDPQYTQAMNQAAAARGYVRG
ncbi:uncharacterized protein Z519_12806 [Cladophialophora bantiana CBS 173.52]|uniref:Uncharacterized protein n=1 Tax=Cladophialophora bantiana (strain ATCC 10958 / CBS 173.52 / CDC B-1940 / NIH 8579) TaxID=1442370 RepID=A0A0D2HQ70_CLAB1|nr:uncharacterized protein Z519_12806 [Cladophialophora bantiana CBS 173.52]KIW86589.1 hypothetical protein Z519_12806 [Cladophialophora bantiana CBS 173.52]